MTVIDDLRSVAGPFYPKFGSQIWQYADTIEAEHKAELDKRAMPDGIEWPHFEDGSLVSPSDTFLSDDGRTIDVEDVLINWRFEYFTLHGHDANGCGGAIKQKSGERVKRPAPQVLAADGLPLLVGETVWWVDGVKYVIDDISKDI